MSDTANAAIPPDVRSQFHRDEYGRVIFYTSPPLDSTGMPESKQGLRHSLRYLADKARSKESDDKKRKALTQHLANEASELLKRAKTTSEDKKSEELKEKLADMVQWTRKMETGTDELYKQMHGEEWKVKRDEDLNKLVGKQEEAFARERGVEKYREEVREEREVRIKGFKWV